MERPVLNDRDSRKDSIVNDTPAIFEIEENSSANGSAPWYEAGSQNEVAKWCGIIIQVSQKHEVDPRLAMAILYMETTHGYYEKIYPDFLENAYPMRKSILPMNINYRYWKGLGVTKEKLGCPFYNIEFGVILIKRIAARIADPTIKKIATIYNFIGAEKVNDYGARVYKLYLTKPWTKDGCRQ